jgi:hypothetical protein
VEVFDDGLEFVAMDWDKKYEKWAVTQGSYEPFPGGRLYLTDDLAEAFYVFRALPWRSLTHTSLCHLRSRP